MSTLHSAPIAPIQDARHVSTGLTKLELIAAMAMQGMLAGTERTEDPHVLAVHSVSYASALIEELGLHSAEAQR